MGVEQSTLMGSWCDTGLSRNDFAGFPQHAQLSRYFGDNMVDVITPREAWIEHDSDILKLVDPSKGLVER